MVLIAAAYAAASVVTLVAYGVDKAAAGLGRRRVPENALHLLCLLGGWPGALVAMPLFRHKRRQTFHVAVTALIALAHVAGWAWWMRR